jgi:hypothetical protein
VILQRSRLSHLVQLHSAIRKLRRSELHAVRLAFGVVLGSPFVEKLLLRLTASKRDYQAKKNESHGNVPKFLDTLALSAALSSE